MVFQTLCEVKGMSETFSLLNFKGTGVCLIQEPHDPDTE